MRNQYQMLWNGTSLGLAWVEYQATADPPGLDVWFTALNNGRFQGVSRNAGCQHGLWRYKPIVVLEGRPLRAGLCAGDKDGLQEMQILPDGTITGSTRMLSNRGGQNAVAWNGRTLVFSGRSRAICSLKPPSV